MLACFGALFCLLASYYLIKPLRNAQFLQEFLPESLPFYYLCVSALSFAVTKLFRIFYDRLSKTVLLSSTFVLICIIKMVFCGLLFEGGKAVTVGFFLFASIYFLLVLAVTWGCINEIFHAEQGERCFGFIATGSTLGCIAGSQMATSLVALGPNLLAISSALLLAALGFILQARKHSNLAHPREPAVHVPPAPAGFWQELRDLAGHRYLRAIATMVVSLAVFTTGLDFIAQKQMDHRQSEAQYMETFASLNREVGGASLDRDTFEFFYGLRQLDPQAAKSALEGFHERKHIQSLSTSELVETYTRYRQGLGARTRLFFSVTNLYQGLWGAVVLMFLLKGIFRYLGVRRTALILPIFSMVSLWLFAAPLTLEAIQTMLIVGGTLNYALNNATKEVLYTVVDTDAKYKIKPLIEGPGMRTGDVIASLVSLLFAAIVSRFGLPLVDKDHMYLVFCSGVVLLWFYQMNWAGREYERLRALDS